MYDLETLEHMTKLQRANPHWYRVESLKPEENTEVLICYKEDSYIDIAELCKGTWYAQNGDEQIDTPSHWMPLPKLP